MWRVSQGDVVQGGGEWEWTTERDICCLRNSIRNYGHSDGEIPRVVYMVSGILIWTALLLDRYPVQGEALKGGCKFRE